MKRLIVSLIAALWAAGAAADTGPDTWGDGTPGSERDYSEVKLCDAETSLLDAADGDCTIGDASSEVIVWATKGFQYVTVDLSKSTGTFTCTVEGNNVGHDEAAGVGQTLHSPALSGSALSVVITAPPSHIWVNCTANSGTVTAVAYGRKVK